MAQYNTIAYTREAVQLEVPETPTDAPLTIQLDSDDIQVYRDTRGFYLLVNTKTGIQRANEGQWAVLMENKVPEVPEVPGIQATGSFQVTGIATGDGKVGFTYNGNEYSVNPAPGQSEDNTATALANTINTQDFTANAVGDTITLSAGQSLLGTSGNLAVVDVSDDTTQGGTPTGLSGGQDFVPGAPETPAIFEILNDGDFQLIYEPV